MKGWVGPAIVSTAVDAVGVLPVFLTGALAVQLNRDIGLDAGALGLVYASYFAAAALLSAPLGRLSERTGPEIALRVGTLGYVVALLGIALFARSPAGLAVGVIASGLATALTRPASTLLIARAVHRGRQGVAFGIKHCSIPLGSLLAGVAVPAALAVGWRWTFAAAAALSSLVAAVIPRRVPGQPVPEAAAGRLDLSLPLLIAFAASFGFGSAAASALGAYTVSTAVHAGMGEPEAGVLVAVGSVVGLASRVAVGAWSDRRSGSQLDLVVGMLLLGAAAFAMLALAGPVLLWVAVPFSFATGWAWLGQFNLTIVRLNPVAPGAAVGITQTGAFIGAIAGPLVLGLLADNASYAAAWLAAAGLSVVAATAAVGAGSFVRRTVPAARSEGLG